MVEANNNAAPANSAPVQQLTISFNSDGRVTLKGPVDNIPVCYFLLEAGMDALKEYHKNKAKQPAIQVAGSLPG